MCKNLLALLIFFFCFELFAQAKKPKLKQLGVQESPDSLGLNSEYRENYFLMESERQKRAEKKSAKSGLSLAPSKDLPRQFEENNFDMNKTWQDLGPLNPPLQLEFEGDF